jgi:paraquat-inducible protein B
MTDNEFNSDGQQAEISNLPRISSLWLIPIVTILVGMWMLYDNWASQGPLITISFSSAEGLEEGKTKIKTRNVHAGNVLSLSMSDDLDSVLVTARMFPEYKGHLTEKSSFWVVHPSISLSGVSGLETLLAGQHIEFAPGSSEVASNTFVGMDKPPVTPPGTPGLHLTLNSDENFSYREGDSILHRGFKVGKVEDIYFNSSERMMYYNAFIEAPYHTLMTDNTRFWDVSGFHAELTGNGIAVHTSGIEALLTRGISFGVPEGEAVGERVTDRAYYQIYPSRTASKEERFDYSLSFVLLVESAVEGLGTGAPVFLRGICVGSVKRAGYVPESSNLLEMATRLPVYIEIYPGQLGLPDSEEGEKLAREGLMDWLEQGMTASMSRSNPIIGQYRVELKLPAEFIESPATFFDGVPVIPVVPDAGLGAIMSQVGLLMEKINRVDVTEIGNSLQGLLEETTATMIRIQALASSADSVVGDAQQQQLVRTLNDTLIEFRRLAESYSQNSPANRELTQLMEVMVDTLSRLEPLLIELNNKPNSMIFTGRGEPEREPQRKKP